MVVSWPPHHDLGHTVMAVELVASACANAQAGRCQSARKMEVIEGDFYTVELVGTFDVIGYWDGFGIGTDDDQRRLLKRWRGGWRPLAACCSVGTPWYAAAVDGRGGKWATGAATADADGCAGKILVAPGPTGAIRAPDHAAIPRRSAAAAGGTGYTCTPSSPTARWIGNSASGCPRFHWAKP
ncbi:MAG: hypothetical protein R2911_33885 [Caldilineaceae bacterium]